MEFVLNIGAIVFCGVLFSCISCVITTSIMQIKNNEALKVAIISGAILFIGIAFVNQRKLDNIERTVKNIVMESETIEEAQEQLEDFYE